MSEPLSAPEDTAPLHPQATVPQASEAQDETERIESASSPTKPAIVISLVSGAVLGALTAGVVFLAAPALHILPPVVAPQTEARLAQTEAALRGLETRIKILEARPVSTNTGASPSPETEGRLAKLEAAVAASQSQQRTEGDVQATSKASRALLMVVALDSLNLRITRDAPLAVPLKMLSDLAVDPARLALFTPYADKGLPNSRILGETFVALAPTLLPVEPSESGSFFERLWAHAKKLVKIRSRSDAVTTDPAVLVQRISAALAQGRWQDVLDTARQLPPQSQDKARDVLRQVQARRDGERTAQTLLDQALVAVVQPEH